jgi:hypothetical protein
MKGSSTRVRKAAVAGSFYPGDKETLRDDIDRLLANVQTTPPTGRPVVVIEPHAGYKYSGQIAAHGYRLLKDRDIRTVIVVSPSHMGHFPFAAVFDGDVYETPLGAIPVDHDLSDRIAADAPRVQRSPRGHIQSDLPSREHAIEVQLPFLQSVLGDFSIVPIVMGDQSWQVCQELGEALAPHLTRTDVLVVASSDLSHFYSYDEARSRDAVFCDLLEAGDPRRLYDSVGAGTCEACGAGPIVASLIASQRLGGTHCTVLSTANSGDVTGDRDRVVGYAAAVVTAPDTGIEPNPDLLDQATQDHLLQRARHAIEHDLGIATPPAGDGQGFETRRGVFVTLKKNGRLRGCIGNLEANRPLPQTVAEIARAAAFNDPRFQPVTREEISQLKIEISVLTPLRRIQGAGNIRVGDHGLVVDDGTGRGLLLPQVAEEYGWDATAFLEHTCEKAGLHREAWKEENTCVYVFEAQVFAE